MNPTLTRASFAAGIAGTFGAASVAGAQAPAKVALSVGTIKAGGPAVLYAAQQLGYFGDAGLEITITYANNGNDLITALQSGKLDIALAIPGVAMRAHEAGYKVGLLFQVEVAHARPPGSGALIVRNEAGLTTLKQMAGKKIAHAGIGTQAWAAMRFAETKSGLDTSAVQELELGYGQMGGALMQGLVDGVVAIEPFTSAILSNKQTHVLSYFFLDSVPNQPTGGYWANSDWIVKNPQIARNFTASMHKAMVYLLDHPVEAKKLVGDWTGLKPEVLAAMTPINWVDRVNKSDWQKTVQMLVSTGVLKAPINIDEILPAASLNPR